MNRNMKRLMELAEEIRQNEREVFFDFNNPQHDAYFCEQMGGISSLQKDFPELYALYLHAKKNGNPVTVGEHEEFRDGIQIIYAYQDQNHILHFKGITALGREMQCICERIHIYHESRQELIVATGRCTQDTHVTAFSFDWDNTCREYQSGNIIFDYYSMWYDPEKQLLQACLYSSQEEIDTGCQSCVQKIQMDDPGHIHTSPDSAILVCYNRHPESTETVDYDYSEAFDPVSHKQQLFLDVAGNVQLDSSFGRFQWVNMTKFVLKLYCDSGVADYNLQGRVESVRNCFKQSDSGFTFRLDKDWKGIVPSARLPIVEDVNFLMRFPFATEKAKGRILVDSTLEPGKEAPDRIRISKLQLLWGCVEAGTQIRLMDGREIAICELRLGDRIAVYGGGEAIVKNIFVGQEEILWKVETGDGKFLVCTKDHPILTESGWKPLQLLRGNDRILTESGELTNITALYQVPGGRVYSLELADASQEPRILTNGLVTGDFSLQNRLSRDSRTEGRRHCAVSEEFLKLQAFFAEGK